MFRSSGLFLRIFHGRSSASDVIIPIALMLFSGFALTRVTKRLKLPNVTGYILAGILIGPFGLNLINEKLIIGTGFIGTPRQLLLTSTSISNSNLPVK